MSFFTLARSLFVAALFAGPAAGYASAQIFGKNGPSLSLPAPKPPKIEIPTPKPPKINLPPVNLPKPPKVEFPPVSLPKPPKIDIPTKPPKINLPPVNLPKPPKVDLPPVSLPKPPVKNAPWLVVPPPVNVPKPTLPKPNLPPIKIPPLIVLKPPQGSTLPVEPDYPRPPKPNTQPSGPPLGQQVPGVLVPPRPQPPRPQPPIVVIPPRPQPQPPVVIVPPQVNPQPPVVVVPPQPPVVVPQPEPPVNPEEPPVTPEPQPQPEPLEPATEGNSLRVTERVLDAAAAKAGIELGDIILKVGDTRVKTEADLTAALEAANGAAVVVTYFNPRDNKVETRELTPTGGSIGIKVYPVVVNLQENEPAVQPPAQADPEPTGPTAVQLTEVTARSAAARAGIQVGDVIVAVGGKRIGTPAELTAALKAAGDEVEVTYLNPEDGKLETKTLKVTAGGIGVKGNAVAVSEK